MAVMLRRRWALMSSFLILAISCIVAIYPLSYSSRNVRAQQAAQRTATLRQSPIPSMPQLTPQQLQAQQAQLAVYQKVQNLRTELALTQQDLAALGVSSQTATTVLGALSAFVAAPGRSGLDEADSAVHQAQGQLQEITRNINLGPRNAVVVGSLSTYQQNLVIANVRRDTVLAGLVSQINGLLNGNQQAMWAAARQSVQSAKAGTTGPMPGVARYITDLSDAQRNMLANASIPSAITQVLTPTQMLQFQMAQQNIQTNLSTVAAAESQVLPLPEAMKMPVSLAPGQ